MAEAQLNPAFADLTIGELTPERTETYLAQRQVASEASARVAREVLTLVMQFAVKEGLIATSGGASGERSDITLKLYNRCILAG